MAIHWNNNSRRKLFERSNFLFWLSIMIKNGSFVILKSFKSFFSFLFSLISAFSREKSGESQGKNIHVSDFFMFRFFFLFFSFFSSKVYFQKKLFNFISPTNQPTKTTIFCSTRSFHFVSMKNVCLDENSCRYQNEKRKEEKFMAFNSIIISEILPGIFLLLLFRFRLLLLLLCW